MGGSAHNLLKVPLGKGWVNRLGFWSVTFTGAVVDTEAACGDGAEVDWVSGVVLKPAEGGVWVGSSASSVPPHAITKIVTKDRIAMDNFFMMTSRLSLFFFSNIFRI